MTACAPGRTHDQIFYVRPIKWRDVEPFAPYSISPETGMSPALIRLNARPLREQGQFVGRACLKLFKPLFGFFAESDFDAISSYGVDNVDEACRCGILHPLDNSSLV